MLVFLFLSQQTLGVKWHKLKPVSIPLSSEEKFLKRTVPLMSGKKIWLITNPSGLGRKNLELRATFQKHNVNLLGYLAMEHGIFGVEEEFKRNKKNILPGFNATIKGKPYRFKATQLYNLYRLKAAELASVLKQADYVLFDVGEVGIRCYTYLSILKQVLDGLHNLAGNKFGSAFASGPVLYVIDHINPVAALGAGGPHVVSKEYVTLVSEMPIPLYHGLTIGEVAYYYNRRYARRANLRVVQLSNYDRYRNPYEYLNWRPTSPNLPGIESVINYQSLVFLEGVNLSVGRGTSGPFMYVGAPFIQPEQVVGHPDLKGMGVTLEEVYFRPTWSHHKGKMCRGFRMHVQPGPGYKPVKFAFHLLKVLFALYPNDMIWFGSGKIRHVDRLWGSGHLRQAVNEGKSWNWLYSKYSKQNQKWRNNMKSYQLYK